MLDFNISMEFRPDISVAAHDKIDRLIVTSCAVHLFDDNRIWSAFDEMCYNNLNRNDYGFGVLDLELGLAGYTGTAYPKVYTKCFDLRTDNGLRIKPMKLTNYHSESKVNQRGETVIGLRYYFREEREIKLLCDCKQLMFECFFALDKPRNTYAVMCQLEKKDDVWSAEYANTFHPSYAGNIKHLVD